jgi:predicted permease
MAQTFLTLFLLILSGVLYRYVPGSPDPSVLRQRIGSLVFNILLPALAFSVMATAPFGSDLITVPLTSVITVVVSYACAWLVYGMAMSAKIPKPTAGALILAAVWCNCTYLGLPIVTGVIGDHMSRVPIVFDLLGMSPMLITLGATMSMRFGRTEEQQRIMQSLRHILTRPPFLATIVGLLANGAHIGIHPTILDVLSYAGSAVPPLMMVSIGLGLRMPRRTSAALLAPAIVIKLVLAPLVAYVVARPLIADPDVFLATMLEAGMPTMMLTMVFADRYGLDTDTLAQAIVVSTIVSMITLPLLVSLFQ